MTYYNVLFWETVIGTSNVALTPQRFDAVKYFRLQCRLRLFKVLRLFLMKFSIKQFCGLRDALKGHMSHVRYAQAQYRLRSPGFGTALDCSVRSGPNMRGIRAFLLVALVPFSGQAPHGQTHQVSVFTKQTSATGFRVSARWLIT